MTARRVLAAAVLLAAAALLAVPAAASARACTGNECIANQWWTGSNPPGWFESEWVTNANIWYIRGVANCGDGRQTQLKEGGWVHSVDLFSRASCPSSLPVLVGGAHDVKHCATCSYTRTWIVGHASPARGAAGDRRG